MRCQASAAPSTLGSVANAGSVAASAPADPSRTAALAWQRTGGHGWVLDHSQRRRLPGRLPAIGGGRIAWVGPKHIVIARRFPAPAPRRLPLPPDARVDALAVSHGWLVVRDRASDGISNLFALSLRHPSHRVYLQGSANAGAIGRPALMGATVVYAFSDASRSEIYEVNLPDGARRVLRRAYANVLYSDPALSSGRLLYERTDRCEQQLLLAPISGKGRERVLLTLPSTVTRDPGYQPGYVEDYNATSLCANRKTGPGGAITLGAAALGTGDAYVSESPADPLRTRIVTIKLG